jgi:hypothetical protein
MELLRKLGGCNCLIRTSLLPLEHIMERRALGCPLVLCRLACAVRRYSCRQVTESATRSRHVCVRMHRIELAWPANDMHRFLNITRLRVVWRATRSMPRL